jgi:hypothetical protein
MATSNVESKARGIAKSMSLMAFARAKGLPRPNHGRNSETGEHYENLAFDNNGELTFVNFSSKMGVLSPKELFERKDELQVVQLNPDKNGKQSYILCPAGKLNLDETIDLFAE